jgi:hypothetical protein
MVPGPDNEPPSLFVKVVDGGEQNAEKRSFDLVESAPNGGGRAGVVRAAVSQSIGERDVAL